MRHLLMMLLLLTATGLTQPQFGDLVQAVQQGDDDRAVRISLKLEQAGNSSFGLYYNQGLAYRNQGQSDRARASFEKALLFAPRDLSTRRRLREVKERLSPEIAENDVTQTPWWTRDEALLVLSICSLLVLGLGIARATARGSVSGKQLILSAALFALVGGTLLLTNPPASRGVVVSSTARLLAKPEGGATGPIVPEGVLVQVEARKGHFVEVATRDGKRGWVREAEIVFLESRE